MIAGREIYRGKHGTADSRLRYHGNEANSEFRDVKLAVRQIKELYRTEIATDFGGVRFKTIRQQMIADGLSLCFPWSLKTWCACIR